jgi:hypothetical protein
MYTTVNFKTKKALREAVAAGREIGVFQPNDLYGGTEAVQRGTHSVTLEGPHSPAPHTWYARVKVVDGRITEVK